MTQYHLPPKLNQHAKIKEDDSAMEEKDEDSTSIEIFEIDLEQEK